MENRKKIHLTDDPVTNIKLMIPLLNEEQRTAMSHVMFGCFIGEEISERKRKKELQEV